jgi:tetratricopeptide (TPR) repeat protein
MLCILALGGWCISAQAPDASRPGQSRFDALQNYRTGRDLESRNRMDEAERYYQEAVRLCTGELSRNPNGMDAYAVLTWTLQRQKKYTEVIVWGGRALRVDGNDYRIIEIMGEAYFYLKDYEKSLSFMQRYANAVPHGDRSSVAYFFIGEIYRLQQKYRHADIAYSTAVRLEPGLALWWYRLGSVRESAGDIPTARDAYREALRLNPNYREAGEGLNRLKQSG